MNFSICYKLNNTKYGGANLQHSYFNPFSWYKKMQKESPVVYDKDFQHFFGLTGTWHLFRYEDVQMVLGDYETFSNQFMLILEESPVSTTLSSSDPPRHKQLPC